MACVLSRVCEHDNVIFEGSKGLKVRIVVRGGGPKIEAVLVAARYAKKPLTVSDNGIAFEIAPDINTLGMLVDSNPPCSPVEICEVCSADPLRVAVLDRFNTEEPPERRALDIRGICQANENR